jgi:uncharacterized protein (DUF488 family)
MGRPARLSPQSSSRPEPSTRAPSALGCRAKGGASAVRSGAGLSLYTIGYEGIDIERFLALLRAHDIQTVVDVRELPLSRKPGFSKKTLERRLARADIQYLHVPSLGCPREIRQQYRADGDWARYEVAFLVHLQMQEAALAALAVSVGEARCALMCFEADASFCHRRMVAAAIAPLRQMPVVHIS